MSIDNCFHWTFRNFNKEINSGKEMLLCTNYEIITKTIFYKY